jgi:intracellular sulfur oxidation DsrE/DsrF family protein
MNEVKVIFHVDEMSKWQLALKNISNLLKAVDADKSYIEVLANSEAVKFYTEDNKDKTIMDLSAKGVKFAACNNALKSLNIKKQHIFDFVEVVPVGVLELINRQQEGYAYIKP